jgi:hypothetical protein
MELILTCHFNKFSVWSQKSCGNLKLRLLYWRPPIPNDCQGFGRHLETVSIVLFSYSGRQLAFNVSLCCSSTQRRRAFAGRHVFVLASSSGLRGHKRTYLTILESADYALFKMVRYVLLRSLRPELDAKTKTCLPAKTRFCHLDEQAIGGLARHFKTEPTETVALCFGCPKTPCRRTECKLLSSVDEQHICDSVTESEPNGFFFSRHI